MSLPVLSIFLNHLDIWILSLFLTEAGMPLMFSQRAWCWAIYNPWSPNRGDFAPAQVVIWQCLGTFLVVITEGGGGVLQASNRNNPAELLNILWSTSQPSTDTPIQRIIQLKMSTVIRLRNTYRQNKWFRFVIQMKIISL